jgi:dethiobiotin synthase
MYANNYKSTHLNMNKAPKFLISGSDTDIGKTRIGGLLARVLGTRYDRVQFIKVLQTGVNNEDHGDAQEAALLAQPTLLETHTLIRFKAPLAPLAAAEKEKKALSLNDLLQAVKTLPACDIQLLEGAGGLAVPLEKSGKDWTDFARLISVDGVILVVADRLGAINQARLVWHYACSHRLKAGVILNQVTLAQESVRIANRKGILQSGIPIWGSLRHNAKELELCCDLSSLIADLK